MIALHKERVICLTDLSWRGEKKTTFTNLNISTPLRNDDLMTTNSVLADNINTVAWIQHFINAELYKMQLKLAYFKKYAQRRLTHT